MNKKTTNKTPAKEASLANNQKLTHIATQFSGPLPAPSILEQYNNTVPGSAERILIMAEKNAEHMRKIEATALNLSASEVKRGQLYGFLISVLSLSTVIFAIVWGATGVATAIGSTTIVSLATVFVYGRNKSIKKQ